MLDGPFRYLQYLNELLWYTDTLLRATTRNIEWATL